MNKKDRAMVAAVAARGYHEGWTPAQLGARQMVKAMEELGEMALAVDSGINAVEAAVLLIKTTQETLGDVPRYAIAHALMQAAGLVARAAFDEGYCGDLVAPIIARAELADVNVVEADLAYCIERLTNEQFDQQDDALHKATADVIRGLRL